MHEKMLLSFVLAALPLCSMAYHRLDSQYEVGPHYYQQDSSLCGVSEQNPFVRPQQPACSLPLGNLAEGFGIHGIAERHFLVPIWMNYTLYRIGQLFAQENLIILSYSNYLGLIIAYSNPEASYFFDTTGHPNNVDRAILRNLAILKHTHLWYKYDLLSADRIAATSILNFRHFLNNSAKNSAKVAYQGQNQDPGIFYNRSIGEGLWSAVEGDLQQSTLPSEWRQPPGAITSYNGSRVRLSQFTMSLAQFLFVGLPFIMPETLGMLKPSEEQLLGWNHLWAVLGFALGIQDEFNIALQHSSEAISRYYHAMFRTFILPSFFSLTKEAKFRMEITANISNEVLPSVFFSFTPNIIMTSLLTELIGIPAMQTRGRLNRMEQELLEVWKRVKASLKIYKQPLINDLNLDFRRNFNAKGRIYYGSKNSNDATAAQYMFP